jgi:uncharacterized protein (DUF2141 family)
LQFLAVSFLTSIGGAQPLAASLGSDSSLCMPGSQQSAVLVELKGLKDRRGLVRIELYSDRADEFLVDDTILERKGAVFRRVEAIPPPAGPVLLCIKAPGPGRYSMSAIHSRSGRRKFNVWNDGVGFPNDPKLGVSKPQVEVAIFELQDGVHRLSIMLNYMRGLRFGPVRGATP